MTEQLDLFNLTLEEEKAEEAFDVGDRVKIMKAQELTNPDVETVCYLETFGGLKGTITDVHKGKRVSYKIQTSKGDAWLHAEELAFIS